MSVTSVNPAANATNEYLTRQSQMESNVRSYPRKLPLAIAKAQGCWVTDVEVHNTSIV
jgi:diaminobutyrate-2-oxoglutarate transaminase